MSRETVLSTDDALRDDASAKVQEEYDCPAHGTRAIVTP
jgi:hypothetical protein